MEGDCTHNLEDWNNKSIQLKCGETQHRQNNTDDQSKNREKIRNRYNQAPNMTQAAQKFNHPLHFQ